MRRGNEKGGWAFGMGDPWRKGIFLRSSLLLCEQRLILLLGLDESVLEEVGV